MFVITSLKLLFNPQWGDMFMIHLRRKFHVPLSDVLLVIAMVPKVEEKFRSVAIIIFYNT
jgi:hypothetical protein